MHANIFRNHVSSQCMNLRFGSLFNRVDGLSRSSHVSRNQNVYFSGDTSETIFYVVSGQVKQLMYSPEGKESVLTIYTSGDIFGESCLAGPYRRQDTVCAMVDTQLREMSSSNFLSSIGRQSWSVDFIKYLAMRSTEQQAAINNLLNFDCEVRLGLKLLQLGSKLGIRNDFTVEIAQWISHEELSKMVGTTRPRVSSFLKKFCNLDLIEIGPSRFITLKENKLSTYLDQICE